MAALTALPLAGATTASEKQEQSRHSGSTILVAYFSRSGNTRVIASLLHRSLNADLFEIQPATPYPEDYLETVEMARQERDSGRERSLAIKVANMAVYDTVFLGFPIWGETTPPVIRAFLSAHKLSGKSLIPFVTHGGYGLGNSQSVLARLAPEARLHKGFSMEADQERRTMNQVNDWLKKIQART
ncbi:flavodoxin [Hylemonella gracilis]|nr:flavodoxin [Hylemonella gracilis]